MNKLFIGLLIVAVGAGVFFLLSKKKNDLTATIINKELLVGKWKAVAAQPAKDSAQPIYQYDFQQTGTILRSHNDSAIADTLHYEWSIANELVWKETPVDSIEKTYSVVLLTKDSLQLQSKDSTMSLFIKAK